MRFFKSDWLVGLLLFLCSNTMAFYSEQECLNRDFELTISHKGKPFGLTENSLHINKNNCVIHLSGQKMKYIKNKWIVDVCREPVHIKKDTGSLEVLKKNGVICSESEKKVEYCYEYLKMINVIQDYGLIFAEGEKEDIGSDHGKVYCTYDLIRKYLFSGLVLSRQNIVENVQADIPATTEEAPAPTSTSTPEMSKPN